MKKNWLTFVTVVLVLSAALSGCAGGKKEDHRQSNSLAVGIQQDIDSLDPHKAVAAGTKEILFNVYEGLVKPDENGNLVPAVASDVHISDDGCEYTFTIRENVKFHDGTTLDAEDVVYSLKRVAGLLDVQDPSVVVDSAFSSVAEISASGNEVKIVLSKPNTELLGYLTCAIIPKDNTTCDKTPVGTGPYKVAEYKALDKVVLKKHADYWGTPANIEDVTFKIIADSDTATTQMLSGTIDVYAYLTADQAKEVEKSFRIEEGSMGLVQGMFLNNESKLFYDVRVRQALNYAVNRQGILDMIADGKGTVLATDMFPGFATYYNESTANVYEYNPTKAKELLAEAGYPDGITFDLIVASGYQYHVDTAQVVADQLKASNITVNIKTIDDNSWLQDVYKERKYDATLYGLAAKVVVPGRVLSRYTQSASNNFINYKNAAYDELFAKAAGSIDDAEKQALYKEMEAMLTDEAASVYLQDPALLVAVNPKLEGYKFYPIFVQDIASLRWTD
ncbi:MAG: ABC transporter substrate-binding protein [Lachnospiraceae bacterium]|nr:ABC transporter substrate-binding protein [Lachnospiraceae bacterium]